MLFHSKFENLSTAQPQKEDKEEALKAETKPEAAKSTFKFTVRSILPTKPEKSEVKAPKPAPENEVPLSAIEESEVSEISEHDHKSREELRQEKRRNKRRAYKKKRNLKMKEIKDKRQSRGERIFIDLVNFVDQDKNVEFDIDSNAYSQKLNVMTKRYKQFVLDDDVVEL